MDFDLTEEQSLLQDSVTKLLAATYSFEQRKSMRTAPKGYNAEMWRQYADLGLLALPFAEADGGLGGGPVEVMLLMEAILTSSFRSRRGSRCCGTSARTPRRSSYSLEAAGVPDHVAVGRTHLLAPARALAGVVPAGVEAQAGDLQEAVAAVGVDGDPRAAALATP